MQFAAGQLSPWNMNPFNILGHQLISTRMAKTLVFPLNSHYFSGVNILVGY